MEFKVTIENFDGPLDLMLHLIKENELDIFDLDISVLTDQYIEYIHAMEQLKLDVACEYLVELASLIELKSKKLLPNQIVDFDEDEYEQQRENDLVNRLIEYQKYKEVSSRFEQMYQQRSQMHDKPQSEIVNDWITMDEKYDNTSPYALIKAMKNVLSRYQISNPYEISITTPKITVEQRTTQLKKKISQYKETFTLNDTMDDCKDVYDVVVTFLAILDMVNKNYLTFTVKKEEVYFRKGSKYE